MTLKKDYPLTKDQEIDLLDRIVAGDQSAYEEFYTTLDPFLKKAHIHSALGDYPATYHGGINPNGIPYEDYMGTLYNDVLPKIFKMVNKKKFSPENPHPVASFVLAKVGYMAMTAFNQEKAYNEGTIPFSRIRTVNANHSSDDDYNFNSQIDRDNIYDGEAMERRQRRMKNHIKEVIHRVEGHRQVSKTCTAALESAKQGKIKVADVAKAVGYSYRGSVYNDFDVAKKRFSQEETEVILETLRSAA